MRSKAIGIVTIALAALVLGAVWRWSQQGGAASRAVAPGAEVTGASSDSDDDGLPGQAQPTELGGNAPKQPFRAPSSRRRIATDSRDPLRRDGGTGRTAARSQGVSNDREDSRARDDFTRLKERLAALDALSQGQSGTSPIDAEAAGLSEQDVHELDLDGDEGLARWEVKMAEKLTQRAENHPTKNDLADGEYPTAREDYGRPEHEFDEIDTNRDGSMDVDEYYAFLADTQRVTVQLDENGDRDVSFEESGLSDGDFAPLDQDDSGTLKPWEMRAAMGAGAFDRPRR
jgi:hypothetical protein